VGDHAPDGALDQELGSALPALAESLGFVAAHEAGETHVGLLGLLLAADLDLGGVHDDHEVTGVDVRGEDRLVLSAQEIGGLHGDVAEVLVLGVDHPPLAFDLGGFCGESLHGISGKVGEIRRAASCCQRRKSFFQTPRFPGAARGILLA